MEFEVELTDQAEEQLLNLDKASQKKVIKDIEKFKALGKNAVDSRDLDKNLYEIRSNNIRSIYTYKNNRMIIIGLIFMKKSQKTPKRYIIQAKKNLELI